MSRKNNAAQLDARDPNVRTFLAQCGTLAHAVSLRLVAPELADIEIIVKQLESAFGQRLAMTMPKQSGRGAEWIAYGTFVE